MANDYTQPLQKTKEEYTATIDKIKSGGAVGIDAQYTHAIIIEYLQQITQRIDALEEKILKLNSN